MSFCRITTKNIDPTIKASLIINTRKSFVNNFQVEGYLKSPLGNTQYPNNITVSNFIDFLLVPTLVYELEYPRTKEIRPWYVFEKLLATFGTFFLLYVNTQSYIIPVLPNASSTSVWEMIIVTFMMTGGTV
ncbi:3160_t:CDS:2 [Entrophospora sp. SA101]|nr:3160_t:CDS:2 [Entrophospora sp. SA101]